MSIDLSSITEIRDKIGIITKITDASGMVLWKYSSAPAPAMITITLEGIAQSYVEIGDDYYRWDDITVEVPSGTVVRCCNASSENRDKESWIYHNDTMVVDGMGLYEFTATKNTTIRESSWKSDYGTYSVGVYITEVPVAFTIDSTTYFAQENMTWAEWFASSHNTTGKTANDVSTITDSNGNTVNLTDVIVNGTAYEVGFGPAMCTVTVTHDAYDAQYFWTDCSTVVGGQTIWLGEGTHELPIGTVIKCEGGAYFSQSSSASMKIYLNEQVVAKTSYNDELNNINRCSYEYTLNGNITIDPRTDKTFTYDDPNKFGAIYITEIPEGHALLSIDYSDPEQFSTSVDGVSYNDTTITVPIGSVVEISAFNLSCYKKCSDGSASVYINDNLVASESERIDYSYTVRGNTAITSYVNPSYCRDCDNYAYDAIISITEQ